MLAVTSRGERRRPMAVRGRVAGLLLVLGSTAVGGCGVVEQQAPLARLVPPDLAERGTLVVATDASYPPAEFLAPPRPPQPPSYAGFEVELVEAAADRLGLDVAWRDVAFPQVLASVTAGPADVAAASLTVTAQRASEVDFVVFAEAGTQWATVRPNTTGVGPADPCGARVAVQAGTVQEQGLRARSDRCRARDEPAIEIQTFASQDDATTAVLAGAADAVVADSPAIAWAVQQAGTAGSAAGTQTRRLTTAGAAYDVEPYGWAVRPEDDDLAQALLAALQAMVADGTYDQVLGRWGVAEIALSADEVRVLSSGVS